LFANRFALGYFITGNFKDKTESIDKYYIKEEGLPNLMRKKIKLGGFNATIQTDQLKSLQPTENDRPKSENDTANYFHAVVAL
jgi:hypothetical protein